MFSKVVVGNIVVLGMWQHRKGGEGNKNLMIRTLPLSSEGEEPAESMCIHLSQSLPPLTTPDST